MIHQLTPMNEISRKCPVVSVVICVYKGEEFLDAAIRSALAQTWPAVEVVVVNDGSPDGSDAICRSHGDRIVYVSQANQGLAHARNAGIRRATGEYIALIDQDDLWIPDKLERQMALFSRAPDLGLVYSDYGQIDRDGRVVQERTERHRMRRGNVLPDLYEHNFISTVSAVFPKRILDQTGYFHEGLRFSLDWDLWLRISHAARVDFDAAPLALWRCRPNHAQENHEICLLEAYRIIAERTPQISDQLLPSQIAGVPNRLARIAFSLGRLYRRKTDFDAARKWIRISIDHDVFTPEQSLEMGAIA